MNKNFFFYIIIFIFVITFNVKANYKELLGRENLICLENIFSNIEKENFTEALLISKNCEDNDLKILTQWITINKNDYFSLTSLLNFKENNYDIPFPKNYKLRLDKAAINAEADSESFLQYFNENDIYQFEVVEKYISYLESINAITNSEKNRIIRNKFINGDHKLNDLKKYISKYKIIFTQEDFVKRVEKYLLTGDIKTAKFLNSFIHDQEYKQYFKILSYFSKKYRSSISSLSKLPEKYAKDEVLFYYIAKYYNYKGQDNEISKYLLSLPDNLKNPVRFYDLRIRNARFHIGEGNYELAYKILSNHQLNPGGYQYAESEWLAGWLALRFINKPENAVKHFQNIYQNVSYPISLSRGSYWLARSYKELGKNFQADKWFKIASKYSTTYYGQMALMEYSQNLTIAIPKLKTYNNSEIRLNINRNKAVKMSLYFNYIGYSKTAYKFAKYAIDQDPTNNNIHPFLAIYKKTNDYRFITKISRYTSKQNILTSANYPIINSIDANIKDKALIFSIIKQESGFDEKAVSRAGAIGFMQLMPKTAKEVSKKLKLKYSYNKLKNNPEYNITLGSYYIDQLLKRFDNSYILAVASYNAGPHNVSKWIKNIDDLREYSNMYDIIDWVELIPYSETRNYVQRILENMVIYLHILPT